MDISDEQIREAFDEAVAAVHSRRKGLIEGIRSGNHLVLDFHVKAPFLTAIVHVPYSPTDTSTPLRRRVFDEAQRRHNDKYGAVQINGGRITFRP